MYLAPLFESSKEHGNHVVAVVSHGIFLNHLWRCIVGCFDANAVSCVPNVMGSGSELIGLWSNTGFVELEIQARTEANIASSVSNNSQAATSRAVTEKPEPILEAKTSQGPLGAASEAEVQPRAMKLQNLSLVVKAVNSVEHLKGLKKTRGGIGSLKHDESQKSIDSFFKKRTIG